MAAGLVLPVSGPYSGAWNSLLLGIMNDDGYELVCNIPGQEVTETDAWGLTLVEAIARGQNWRCRFRGMEWNRAGLLAILQMFGTSAAGFNPAILVSSVGNRWTSFCQTLLLTSLLGNPPATPQSLTAVNSGFGPNTQTSFNLTSKVREMPLELVLFPYQTIILGVTYQIPFSTT